MEIFIFCIILFIGILFGLASNSNSGALSTCIEDENLKKYEHVSMEDESNNDLYNTLINIFKSGQTYEEWGIENGFKFDPENKIKIERPGKEPIEVPQTIDSQVSDHFEKLIDVISNDHDREILEALNSSLTGRNLCLSTGKGLILNPKEKCYFRGVNTMVHTIQTILKDISYSGFRYGTGMLKAGNMFVSRNDITGWKEYGRGTMYVTNQRVILIGIDNKTKNISLSNIANYSLFENNGIIFTLKNGNPIIFSMPMDGTFHFNTIYGTLFEDDLCPCLLALDKAFEDRKNK